MKKNIFLVVLAFLVVGLIGFITYDNFFKPSEKCSTKKETKKIETNEKTADERYKEYLDNLAKSIEKTYVNKHPNEEYSTSISNSTRVENQELGKSYSISINNKLELTTTAEITGLNNGIIANNVVSYYIVHTGNGGFNSLYYITTEGKVYSANIEIALYNNTSLDIKEMDSVKNIVEVKNGNSTAGFPIYVDIDGNIFTPNVAE